MADIGAIVQRFYEHCLDHEAVEPDRPTVKAFVTEIFKDGRHFHAQSGNSTLLVYVTPGIWFRRRQAHIVMLDIQSAAAGGVLLDALEAWWSQTPAVRGISTAMALTEDAMTLLRGRGFAPQPTLVRYRGF